MGRVSAIRTQKVLVREAGMEGDVTVDTYVREGARVLAYDGGRGLGPGSEAGKETGSSLAPADT